MRNSCNGCRILRKGCSEDCTIRPCLQWIKSSEAQANATVFLAKFYGRAGLINLIGSGPEHLRPGSYAYGNFSYFALAICSMETIFDIDKMSLLYEACGRIANPIYGSIGLMWTGSWDLCQTAVQAVLKGDPIAQIPIDTATSIPVPPLKGSDIRHVSKDLCGPSTELHKVARTRTRFKKSVHKIKPGTRTGSSSMESADQESEGSHVSQAEPDRVESGSHEGEVGLDLTLGLALSVLT